MCLGQYLFLASEFGLEILSVFGVVSVLLLELCELSLEAGLSLCLSFLVGVDLARSQQVIEGDARIGFDDRIDLLGSTLGGECKQDWCVAKVEIELTSFLLMLRIFLVA